MPPKPKFEKNDVISAAFEIAKASGIEAVTAREVGAALGCSTRPLFTYFSSMEELQTEVKEKAWDLFMDYLQIADSYSPAFKMRGMQMIKFAQDEPKLFQFLFMTEQPYSDFNAYMKNKISGFENDICFIQNTYVSNRIDAEIIFNQMWVFTYGICVLIATKVCTFTQQEIAAMLGRTFIGTMMVIKSGKLNNTEITPAANGTEKSKVFSQNFFEAPKEN